MNRPSYSSLTSGLAFALAASHWVYTLARDIDGNTPRTPYSVAHIVDNVRPGTVYIGVKFQAPPDQDKAPSPGGGSQGSGFVIDGRNGYIVTNNHVIESAAGNSNATVEITLTNGKKLSAQIVGRDTVGDLAVLKVDSPTPLPEVKFGDSEAVRTGDWVLAIGNPYGLFSTVTTGIVSALKREAGPYEDMIQTDAAINSGNSGGALFNASGEVVGVNTAIISPTKASVGIGLSIPSSRVLKTAAQIIAHGDIQHGWLGVSLKEVTEEIAKEAGLNAPAGVFLIDVIDQGPAQAAGLKANDIVLEVNGEKIDRIKKLTRLIIGSPPGSDARVVYWRDGATHTVTVKLGDYKTLLEMQAKEAQEQEEPQETPETPAPQPEAPAP